MSEMNRVQRWRQQQRAAGKDAWTIWVHRELKLYIEDLALKRHCSSADLIEQALTTCYQLSGDVTDTVTDTSATDTPQLRMLLQQELRAFFSQSQQSQGVPPILSVTDTDIDTEVISEPTTYVNDTVSDTYTVTDTVTDTPIDPRAGYRREAGPEGVADSVTDTVVLPMTYPVMVMVTDTVVVPMTASVTDTVSNATTAPIANRKAPSHQRTVTDAVSDTVTVTGPALEPFDTTRYRLGKLCPRHHDYHGTGQSLRMNNKSGGCRACDVEQKRARRQARRQEVSA